LVGTINTKSQVWKSNNLNILQMYFLYWWR